MRSRPLTRLHSADVPTHDLENKRAISSLLFILHMWKNNYTIILHVSSFISLFSTRVRIHCSVLAYPYTAQPKQNHAYLLVQTPAWPLCPLGTPDQTVRPLTEYWNPPHSQSVLVSDSSLAPVHYNPFNTSITHINTYYKINTLCKWIMGGKKERKSFFLCVNVLSNNLPYSFDRSSVSSPCQRFRRAFLFHVFLIKVSRFLVIFSQGHSKIEALGGFESQDVSLSQQTPLPTVTEAAHSNRPTEPRALNVTHLFTVKIWCIALHSTEIM